MLQNYGIDKDFGEDAKKPKRQKQKQTNGISSTCASHSKGNNGMKEQPAEGEKAFSHCTSDQGLITI
jgi:hypothetical protein